MMGSKLSGDIRDGGLPLGEPRPELGPPRHGPGAAVVLQAMAMSDQPWVVGATRDLPRRATGSPYVCRG